MLNPVRPRPSRARYLALLVLVLALVGAGIAASLYAFTNAAQTRPSHRTATGAAATPRSGAVVFSGNFETGDISQWTWGAQCANYTPAPPGSGNVGNVSIITDVVAQGRYSARFDLPADISSNTSCEVLRKRTEALGSDQFYAQEIYFPSGWRDPSAWGMGVGQYNFSGVGQGAPVGVDARADHVNLSVSSGLCVAHGSCQYTTGNDWPNDQGTLNTTLRVVPPGTHLAATWQQWIVHVHWAADSSGHVDGWWRQRGATSWTKTVNWGGYPTVQWTSGHAPEANDVTSDKIGAYRGPAIFPISISQDGFCVASSFSAAASCL